jgi:hypothetical protein
MASKDLTRALRDNTKRAHIAVQAHIHDVQCTLADMRRCMKRSSKQIAKCQHMLAAK